MNDYISGKELTTYLYGQDDERIASLCYGKARRKIENTGCGLVAVYNVMKRLGREQPFEDIIRDPEINPAEALTLKRRIDKSNQDRTDLVERIDSYFLTLYKNVSIQSNATINTESPAWAIDRLSILALKIYHMREQAERTDASAEHLERCKSKLQVLLEQQKDLSSAIDTLLDDIEHGRKYMKVYKQMKMYNDADTNPILYGKKK